MGNPDQRPVSIDFGALLRRHRLAAGLSQEGLAERARMSARAVRALERGERRTPQFETVSLLGSALALSAEQRRELVEAARWATANRHGSIAVGPWSGDGRPMLPLSLTRFVGREKELDEILALMREHRLVTLTGTGGIGKTQTALRAARAFGETANTNVCFVGLAPLSDPALVAQTIATALHVQEVPNHPLLETLAVFLRNKTQTLVLDNCEHVIREVAVVADALLRTCPNVRILATSREALRAAGERAYRLPSLDGAASETLFIDRAQAVDSHFRVKASDRAQLATLCRRLDGIPLAIELAAVRVNLLTLEVLNEKLNERFTVLTGGERTAPSRQQTMLATIDWSYDLLSEGEQRVFERLSVFAGGCTLSSAQAVCAGEDVTTADVFEILSSLVGKSLVAVDITRSEPRYSLLESFRQFGRGKLIVRGEQRAVARQHALAALEHEEWTWRICNSHAALWVDRVRSELENLRAAIEWTLSASGDAPLAQRLIGSLHMHRNFPMVDRRRWIARAFETVDENTPLEVIADLHLVQASIASDFSQQEAMITSSRKALAGYRALHDSRRMVVAAYYGVTALTFHDRLAEAKELLEEVLPLAREAKAPLDLAAILRAEAMIGYLNGDADSGRKHLAEALRIAEALGSELGVFHILEELAECEFCAGNAELAMKYAEDALAALRGLPAARARSRSTLSNIPRYLVELARFDEAEEHARESLTIALESHADIFVAWNLENLAAITGLRNRDAPDRLPSTYARAARVLGFVNARLEALEAKRDHTSKPQYERVLAIMNASLGSDTVASLMAEGAVLSEEEAIELATRAPA